MGLPLIPALSTLLQAGGLAASIFGAQDAQEEAERRAREQARQAAWTNLISVAGGGGPVAVPQVAPAAQNDLQTIGQLAGSVGGLIGDTAGAYAQQQAQQQQNLDNAMRLAEIGVAPEPGTFDDFMQAGLEQRALNQSNLLELQQKEMLSQLSSSGLSPAQQSDQMFRLANIGALNPEDFGGNVPSSYLELNQHALADRDLRDAQAGIYQGADPNLQRIGQLSRMTTENDIQSGVFDLARVGALDPNALPEGVDVSDRMLEFNELNIQRLQGQVDAQQAKLAEAVTPGGIQAMGDSDLRSLESSMRRALTGNVDDPITMSILSATPGLLDQYREMNELPEGAVDQFKTIHEAVLAEIQRRITGAPVLPGTVPGLDFDTNLLWQDQ